MIAAVFGMYEFLEGVADFCVNILFSHRFTYYLALSWLGMGKTFWLHKPVLMSFVEYFVKFVIVGKVF